MILEFIALTPSNFCTFTTSCRINLTGSAPGLVYVRGQNLQEPSIGSNNVGKSTIFKALTWVLYGACLGNLRNPDITPWGTNASTTVTLELKIDGKKRTIQRSTRPNQLQLDGEDVGQADIERLIGLSFKTFTHTLLLGQGQPLFFDLPPREKMQLFSETLNLERWEERSAQVDRVVSKKVADKTNLENALQAGEETLAEIKRQLKVVRADMQTWAYERQEETKNQDAHLKTLRQDLTKAQKRHSDLDLAFDSACTELKALRERRRSLQDTRQSLERDRTKTTLELQNLDRQRKALQRELDALGEADVCPTCGQSIKGTDLAQHKRHLRQQIAALRKDESAAQKEEDKHAAAIVNANKHLSQVQSEHDKFSAKADEAESGLDRARDDETRLHTQLQMLEEPARGK